MKKLLGPLALVLMAVSAAAPAAAADKSDKAKVSKKQLEGYNWGRRTDVKARYWPFHMYPGLRIY